VPEVPIFLAQARKLYPQHFAMLVLGIATGAKAVGTAALRRKGSTPDVLWDKGKLLVRRSETKGEVVDRLKQGKRGKIDGCG